MTNYGVLQKEEYIMFSQEIQKLESQSIIQSVGTHLTCSFNLETVWETIMVKIFFSIKSKVQISHFTIRFMNPLYQLYQKELTYQIKSSKSLIYRK